MKFTTAEFLFADPDRCRLTRLPPRLRRPALRTPRPDADDGGRGGGGGAYPQHPPESPEVVARGKALYGVQCNFCHGSDARGGEGGPNLLRSQMVLSDQKGELIAPVVQNGRPDQGMPKFDLTNAQIADIAAYIHSFRVGGYDVSRDRPRASWSATPKRARPYFKSKCASCHSVTGDLKGFGAKFTDPKQLQQTWLMPGGGRGGVRPRRRGPACQRSAHHRHRDAGLRPENGRPPGTHRRFHRHAYRC